MKIDMEKQRMTNAALAATKASNGTDERKLNQEVYQMLSNTCTKTAATAHGANFRHSGRNTFRNDHWICEICDFQLF